MKKTELLPTHENLVNCFLNDSIERNEDLAYFIKLINSISGAYSIALDGNWGSGKTFFVKQAKLLFDTYNEYSQMQNGITGDHRELIKLEWNKILSTISEPQFEPESHICVYFDAWSYDSNDDPISSIIFEISRAATSSYSFPGEHNFIDIATSIIDLITGRNCKSLIQSLKAKNIIDSVGNQVDLQVRINEFIDSLLPEHGNRLLVFIDELDRCNPCYAVKLLEKIKHYFANENVTFIFSCNLQQLQFTVQQHYGVGFDAYKYLDRFFDLIQPMPQLKLEAYYRTINTSHFPKTIKLIAKTFVNIYHLEMRETSKYFETLNSAANSLPTYSNGALDKDFCKLVMLPIALGLQKHNINHYHNFMNGSNAIELVEILSRDDFIRVLEHFFDYSDDPNTDDSTRLIYRKEIIQSAYNALFDSRYLTDGIIRVGNICFSLDTYHYFSQITGMLNCWITYK